MATIQVSLVEDQTQTRQGLTALIDGTPGVPLRGGLANLRGDARTCGYLVKKTLPGTRAAPYHVCSTRVEVSFLGSRGQARSAPAEPGPLTAGPGGPPGHLP